MSPLVTQPTQTEKRQPWRLIKQTTTEPRNAGSQGLHYNFAKGETMVIDGSAQRGNGFVGGQWTVEAESNKASAEGQVVG
ncbi:hypothetical protein BP5796_02884 [Coleophoma crateriformis]|uniref:Uncharacterized protein n=1 Tax=Coleophoma crateriformis TaxID=565419 RepID=A0A3D8SZP8_9HELO|nr:hypothetical protein BP5796_02884 [Coleophoma crateriformis]